MARLIWEEDELENYLPKPETGGQNCLNKMIGSDT